MGTFKTCLGCPPPHYQVLGPVSLLSKKLEASSMLVERTVLFPA